MSKLEFKQLDFNPRYSIVDNGLVYDNLKSRFLKEFINHSVAEGEDRHKRNLYVYLHDDSKKAGHSDKSVAKLVANAFLSNANPNNYKHIKHKNGNYWDNHVENLEWCSYPKVQAKSSKVTKNKKGKGICVYDKYTKELVKEFDSLLDVSKWLQETKGASKYANTMVSNCLRGHRRTSYGYIYRYKDDSKNLESNNIKNAPRYISVYDYKTGSLVKRFKTLKECVHWLLDTNKSTNPYSAVSLCLNGYRTHAFGYTFKYTESTFKNYVLYSEKAIKRHNRIVKPVYQYRTDGRYVGSYQNVFKALEMNTYMVYGGLQSAIVGNSSNGHFYKGYYWFYNKQTPDRLKKIINNMGL